MWACGPGEGTPFCGGGGWACETFWGRAGEFCFSLRDRFGEMSLAEELDLGGCVGGDGLFDLGVDGGEARAAEDGVVMGKRGVGGVVEAVAAFLEEGWRVMFEVVGFVG